MRPPDAEAQAKPHKLTQGEMLTLFVERATRSAPTEHSSVTLKTNAKGEIQIDVTVRTGETPEVATVDDAASKAKAVFDVLRAFYPLGALEPGAGSSDG